MSCAFLSLQELKKQVIDKSIWRFNSTRPLTSWGGDYEIQVAQKLEKRYPEEILKYYLSGLGHLDRNAERHEYTRKANLELYTGSLGILSERT